LPHAVREDWLASFTPAWRATREFGISLLGGDTGAGLLAVTITAFALCRGAGW